MTHAQHVYMLYILTSQEGGAMLLLRHVLRVLEGGINMQNRNNP